MAARFRAGVWADHVHLARACIQKMNDASDEEARALASSPSFARQLELASAVVAMNEALIVASAVVAWGESVRRADERRRRSASPLSAAWETVLQVFAWLPPFLRTCTRLRRPSPRRSRSGGSRATTRKT